MRFDQYARRDAVRPVQVIKRRHGGLVLDDDALQQVLEHPLLQQLPDCPVAVVAIGGAARTGKSFICNLFLEILYATQAQLDGRTDAEWRAPGTRFRGFHFVHSCRTDTRGMWMWGEPIIVPTLRGATAFVLVDIQGLFDPMESKEEENLTYTLFALSTLISSVQLINIMHRAESNLCKYYEMILKYASELSAMLDSGEQAEAIFQSLYFCVRDWPSPVSFPYGMQENDDFIEQQGDVRKDKCHALEIVRNIAKFYASAGAILLPHPGIAISEGSRYNRTKDGETAIELGTPIEEIDEYFLEIVGEAAQVVFFSCFSEVVEGEASSRQGKDLSSIFKKINGLPCKADDIAAYIKALCAAVEQNEQSALLAQDVVTANRKVAARVASRDALRLYEQEMRKALEVASDGLSTDDFSELHQRCCASSRDSVHAAAIFDGDAEANLVAAIESRRETFGALNDALARAAESRRRQAEHDARIAELAVTAENCRVEMETQRSKAEALAEEIKRLEVEMKNASEEMRAVHQRDLSELAAAKSETEKNLKRLAQEMEQQKAEAAERCAAAEAEKKELAAILSEQQASLQRQQSMLAQAADRTRQLEQNLARIKICGPRTRCSVM